MKRTQQYNVITGEKSGVDGLKGGKRNELAGIHKMLKDAQATRDAIERFEKLEKRVFSKRRERATDVPYTPAERMKRHREKTRNEQLPASRKCPVCGEIKLCSRQWVVLDGVAFCKSCKMKGHYPNELQV